MQRCFVAFLLAVVFINICSLTPICPINEEWNICGQFCEPACGPPATPSIICHEIICNKNLTGGCRCINGTLRNQDNICVLPEDC